MPVDNAAGRGAPLLPTNIDELAVRQPQATRPPEVPVDVKIGHPSLYFNRELSDVDFNWRVLQQAADPRTPLYQRVKFLAISAGNLDEFFQKRVGGLKRQQAAAVTQLSPDGRTPSEQLDLVRAASRHLMDSTRQLWLTSLRPKLARRGVEVLTYDALGDVDRAIADRYYRDEVYPLLTPLAVDPSRPFPLISNLSLSLAVLLRDPGDGAPRFVRVKVPTGKERWVRLSGRRVIPVERLVAHHAATLFPGMDVIGAYPFSLIRYAYLEHSADIADDLIEMISEALREQRFAPVVRLDVELGTPPEITAFLKEQLGIGEEDIYESTSLLRLADLGRLVVDPEPGLIYRSWTPREHERLATRPGSEPTDIFSILRAGDILVHHPYQSYDTSVLRLLREAAEDESVVAIKQTLYRTADESQVVDALIKAANHGKQVSVLVEIQARFDEQANISWGEVLEDAGVHVAYGVPKLKTHAKAILVLRREAGGIVGYCHVGTGNYNELTAQQYTDLSLLTSRDEIADDLVNLFHSLTGYAPDQTYQKIMVAPRYMADCFHDLIDHEIARQEVHGDGHLIAKFNGLDDVGIIDHLYRASQAGVRCELIVRGLCRLRPGLPGVSENITVRSIIGRFLEHDRVFYFHSGGQEKVFMGSADWRRRNLHERVEVVTPVEDREAKRRIISNLRLALADNRLAWELKSDGRYEQLRPGKGRRAINYQSRLMSQTSARKRRS